MRRRALALVVSTVLALASARARAEDPEALVTRGIELRERGKDDQALELFRKAEQLAPTPRTRAQVALAEQALGIWVAAEAHLTAALAAKGDPWIEKNRAALASALDVIQKHVGQLEVRGGVAGAEVFVDGARLGALPMSAPWRVEVGRRSIEVRAPGYHRVSRATDIAAGATTRETIELVREDAPSGRPGAVAGGARSGVAEPPRGGVQRTMGWIFVGTGGALAVVGVVGVIARQSAVSAYNADQTCPGMGSASQPPGCEDHISTANTWRTISIASFIAGGALGVGGAILVLTAPSSRAPAVALACGPLALGLACSGEF